MDEIKKIYIIKRMQLKERWEKVIFYNRSSTYNFRIYTKIVFMWYGWGDEKLQKNKKKWKEKQHKTERNFGKCLAIFKKRNDCYEFIAEHSKITWQVPIWSKSFKYLIKTFYTKSTLKFSRNLKNLIKYFMHY